MMTMPDMFKKCEHSTASGHVTCVNEFMRDHYRVDHRTIKACRSLLRDGIIIDVHIAISGIRKSKSKLRFEKLTIEKQRKEHSEEAGISVRVEGTVISTGPTKVLHPMTHPTKRDGRDR
ncbi:hypothetical protein Y032_0165g3 [Ancylostoma ceylanicum]|uniref:Uncharacterized protein n=1 Tax=Ancylostoma ceylanicum TaxID=53326 RepID=A0A016SX83_9BILA|nr:hypothetical protein Y032_0165g3 [Ancylostoma ceylanicum]